MHIHFRQTSAVLPFVFAAAFILCACSQATGSPQQEKEAKSSVASVALFKNGLSVVRLEVPIPGPGIYRLADVAEPVHGTFLVESGGSIEARIERRSVPARQPARLGVNLQDELVGLKVTIHGRSTKAPIVGTVLSVPKQEIDLYPPVVLPGVYVPPAPVSRFLLLRTEAGTAYVDLNEIEFVEADGQAVPETPMESRSVLLLVVGDEVQDNTCRISYLAHGLSWAPSYNIELLDAQRLTIEQHAAIRNELMDLKDTDVSLISGYPNVQFGHVVSPLSASQTWQHFFQQLGGRGGDTEFSNSIMLQNAAYSGGRDASGDVAVAPNLGDTIDLHYHSIGKRTLHKGAAFSMATGKAEAGYKRIVEWTIPDNRDEWGNPSNNRRVDPSTGEPLQDDVWDALKFKNPLPFPMTSAPVMVTTEGRFSGQSQVLWTNMGEEATVRVNKALSIRARNVEYENQIADQGQAERDVIYIGGRRFRKVTVNGEMRLCNHRAADIEMIIKRQFSGDYVNADAAPKIDLREEGVWTINKRNELTWTITLQPNAEQTIKYQYSVLIPF